MGTVLQFKTERGKRCLIRGGFYWSFLLHPHSYLKNYWYPCFQFCLPIAIFDFKESTFSNTLVKITLFPLDPHSLQRIVKALCTPLKNSEQVGIIQLQREKKTQQFRSGEQSIQARSFASSRYMLTSCVCFCSSFSCSCPCLCSFRELASQSYVGFEPLVHYHPLFLF